jgi:hypothetical protein
MCGSGSQKRAMENGRRCIESGLYERKRSPVEVIVDTVSAGDLG